jgi:hypothetical protein
LLIVLVGAGILLGPVVKRIVIAKKHNLLPVTPVPVLVDDRDFKDAFRDARQAQLAAEQLSTTMFRFDKNRELIALVTKTGDDAGVQTYRRAEEALEQTRIDAETAFLIAAKRLNGYPPEATEKAYKDIEEEVSKAGVGWRTRVAQMLPKYVSAVTPDTLRVDPAFLDALKQLQVRP